MHIISYATIAQSQFPMVVKYNTVSLRHKHSPETLFKHINQCIHIVLAFTSNARQLIIHLKHFFFQQKFHFLKVSFFFSRKFCLILLTFILFEFFFKKNYFFQNLLFTFDRSTLLLTVMFIITVHNYCRRYCLSQYKNCIATHFFSTTLAIQLLQYNFPAIHSQPPLATQSPWPNFSHNTLFVL